MEFEKKISVVIPCYNRELFINSAIDSVLAQKYNDVEIIIVDDGSIDRSQEIVNAYGESVRLIAVENGGPSRARNIGWRAAKGDFIKFHDSDDIMPNGALAGLSEAANGVPYGTIVFGDAVAVGEDGISQSSVRYGYAHTGLLGIIPNDLILSDVMSVFLPLFPKSILESVGGLNENILLAEDYELSFRLILNKNIFYRTNVTVSKIRQHKYVRLTKVDREIFYKRMIYVNNCILERLGESDRGIIGKRERCAMARLIWRSGRLAVRAHRPEEAKELFLQSQAIGPGGPSGEHPIVRILYKICKPTNAEKILQKTRCIVDWMRQ